MNVAEITPLILTYNEESNLRATLDRLRWAEKIVIIDSGSIDQTLRIADEFSNVVVRQRTFDNHTDQWNFGLTNVVTEWVLTLDADYLCPGDLPAELAALQLKFDVYYARFRYCILGHPLRASLYPPRAVLFRPQQRKYIADGHTQTLDVAGVETGFLNTILLHDDRKPLSQWCSAQFKYANLEAIKILASQSLGWKDRIRKRIIFAPALTLLYCLFVKGLLLDGWRGIYYAIQRTFAELLLSLLVLDQMIRGKSR